MKALSINNQEATPRYGLKIINLAVKEPLRAFKKTIAIPPKLIALNFGVKKVDINNENPCFSYDCLVVGLRL